MPTRPRDRRPRLGGLLVTLVVALPGCLEPERSPLLRPDWEDQLAEARRHTPELPQTPGPRPADDAEWIDTKLNATGPLELSIEEATVLALRNNRDLAIQQLNPVIVGTFERIERGVFDPQAFAEFAYGEETAIEIDRGTGTRFSVDDTETTAIVGVRQNLPTGTDVELSVGQNREDSSRTPEQQDARLGLTVTQQLLRGAGPAVNLVRIRQARIDTRASLYELRGFTRALLAEAESAYWRYVLAIESIDIFEGSLDLAQRQLNEIQQRIDIGVLPETDAAVARAEVARRQQDLIDARSDLESQRFRLLRLVNPPNADSPGSPGSLDRPVTATSAPSPDAQPLTDLEDRLKLAEQSRPDLAEARLRLEQNRLETIVTRNGLLPRLEVFIALGNTGFDDTFDDSFRALDDDTYDLAAGVRFSKILGNDAARARDLAAYASRRQSAAAIENLTQLIRLDLRLAATELERARQQIDASRTTRALQEDVVQAERQRLEAGTGTALLVAQAQRDLLQSRIAEVESVVAYRLALINLYLAEGTLLDRRGYVTQAGAP